MQHGVPTARSDPSVHLWYVRLDDASAKLNELLQLLSDAERERWASYRFEPDRRRFLVRRAALRQIIGAWSGELPTHVSLEVSSTGKPVLGRNGSRKPRLCFNSSSSGNLAVVALAHDRELGVDLERVAPLPDLDQVARTVFTPVEQASIDAARTEQRRLEVFYRTWCQKEALLKAWGVGLSLPAGDIETSRYRSQTWKPANVAGAVRLYPPGRWSVQPLEAPEGHTAALAAEGHDWTVVTHGFWRLDQTDLKAVNQATGAYPTRW
jgi:4'-phosphopantetheinyl transferase